MKSVLISFVISIFILGLLYYFFVRDCEKDQNKKYNLVKFSCDNIVNPTSQPSFTTQPSFTSQPLITTQPSSGPMVTPLTVFS